MSMIGLGFLCKEDITVSIYKESTNMNGAPEIDVTLSMKARVESINKTGFAADGRKITISKRVFSFEKLSNFDKNGLSGKCTYNGDSYEILSCELFKDNNGNNHHIEMELF